MFLFIETIQNFIIENGFGDVEFESVTVVV